MVSGWLDGAHVRSAGPVGEVNVGGMRGSTFFVAVNPDVTALPDSAKDFDAPSAIKRLTIRGPVHASERSEPSFVDSRIAAWTIGRMKLQQVASDNGGDLHGVVSREIRAYRRSGQRAAFSPYVHFLDLEADFSVRLV